MLLKDVSVLVLRSCCSGRLKWVRVCTSRRIWFKLWSQIVLCLLLLCKLLVLLEINSFIRFVNKISWFVICGLLILIEMDCCWHCWLRVLLYNLRKCCVCCYWWRKWVQLSYLLWGFGVYLVKKLVLYKSWTEIIILISRGKR